MAKTRNINNKEDKSNRTDTRLIQSILKRTPEEQSEVENMQVTESFLVVTEEMNEDACQMQSDAMKLKKITEELNFLVKVQQPSIHKLEKTLNNAHAHVKQADETLTEIDNSKCIIL